MASGHRRRGPTSLNNFRLLHLSTSPKIQPCPLTALAVQQDIDDLGWIAHPVNNGDDSHRLAVRVVND